jgi:hypothetical protein
MADAPCPPEMESEKLNPINGDRVRPYDYSTLRHIEKTLGFPATKGMNAVSTCFEKQVRTNIALLPDYVFRIYNLMQGSIEGKEFTPDAWGMTGSAGDYNVIRKTASIPEKYTEENWDNNTSQTLRNKIVDVAVAHESGHLIGNFLGHLRNRQMHLIAQKPPLNAPYHQADVHDSEHFEFANAYKRDVENLIGKFEGQSDGREKFNALVTALSHYLPPDLKENPNTKTIDARTLRQHREETYAQLLAQRFGAGPYLNISGNFQDYFPESYKYISALDNQIRTLTQQHPNDQGFIQVLTSTLQDPIKNDRQAVPLPP